MYEFQDFYNIDREDKPVVVGWPEEKIAKMLYELYGDECPCNYNGIDEWLPYVCELIDSCPRPQNHLDCWKQFLKHYKLRGRSQ